jgi:hypothetical protein
MSSKNAPSGERDTLIAVQVSQLAAVRRDERGFGGLAVGVTHPISVSLRTYFPAASFKSMDHPVLKLPDKLDLNHLLQCARRLDAFRGSKAITLDMGGSRHFPPFPMLFLAAKILEVREAHPGTRFDVKNYANHDYAAHMGFFKAAGLTLVMNLGKRKAAPAICP